MITPLFVKKLIMEGLLQVKFNVSKVKDHGTLWKVILQNEIKVKPINHKETLVKLEENDDFFGGL